MSFISCNNISLAYDGKTVVDNLSFEVNSGDYLCIVGENGSGKSTLIKGLLGLLHPISGSIKFGDGLKSNQIGYLPQQTAHQRDFPASVFEVVLSGCINKMGLRPFYSRADKKRALDNMQRLHIEALKNTCYHELSGGQQQRVLLARALCATDKLLLLDEPVSGLDPIVTNEMYELIDDLNKTDKLTIIMVSHDIISSINRASHILHLKNGPVFFGKTEDYRSSEIAKTFLGEEK